MLRGLLALAKLRLALSGAALGAVIAVVCLLLGGVLLAVPLPVGPSTALVPVVEWRLEAAAPAEASLAAVLGLGLVATGSYLAMALLSGLLAMVHGVGGN